MRLEEGIVPLPVMDFHEWLTIVVGFEKREQKQFKHRNIFFYLKERFRYGVVMKPGSPISQHILIIILLFTITFFLLNLLVLPAPA